MKAVNSFAAVLTAFIFSLFLTANFWAQTETVAKTNAQTIAGKNSDERYRIGFRDSLSITVYSILNEIKVNETVSIAADGTIRLPKIPGTVSVICKTETEVSAELTKLYGTFYLKNPYVSVRLAEQRSQTFAVIGAVKKPDNYPINRRVHLLELLSIAGGYDVEKAGTKMIVARPGSRSSCDQDNKNPSDEDRAMTLYQFNLKDVLQGKQDLLMEPGDIVSVLEADVAYVYGNVNKQGSIKLNRPVTLRQAIAEAEGFAPASKKDKIRILRLDDGSSEWKDLVYNLKEIDAGKVPDPFLMPNDIVAVSEDKVKSIVNSLTKSLTNGIPSVLYRVPVP